MLSLIVCGCLAGSSCARFASETWSGEAGLAAESYKRALWHATSGNLMSELELAQLRMEVAAVLSMGSDGSFASTSQPPKYGNCARVFTVKLLKYRICQGSPYTAAALILIPTFPRAHQDFPLIPCLYDMVTRVKDGLLPNYRKHKPDLTTVWLGGKIPKGYVPDARLVCRDEQDIWKYWAIVRAREMLGEEDAWEEWPYPNVAPIPSPARIEWPIAEPEVPLELPPFTSAPLPVEDRPTRTPTRPITPSCTVYVGGQHITVRLPRPKCMNADTPFASHDPSTPCFHPSQDWVDPTDRTREFVHTTLSTAYDRSSESMGGSESENAWEPSSTYHSSGPSVAVTRSNPPTATRSLFDFDSATIRLSPWDLALPSSTWQSSTQSACRPTSVSESGRWGRTHPRTLPPPTGFLYPTTNHCASHSASYGQ